MRTVDLIEKKKRGGCYSRDEIQFFIDGITDGSIPDYQASAWLMSVWFQGLNDEETAYLTEAMADSGEKLDLSSLGDYVVDKHSTGGVGDKITLVLIPLLAAAGLPVAKLSGRGLGHTGGTIDKLESIEGFRTDLSIEEFLAQVKKTGVAIAAQTLKLTPADGRLYALRDVTATVDSLPFICSSVVSKKIASGANIIILDVKCGHGAFIKTKEQAIKLSQLMVSVGNKLGRKITAVITGMGQPLGFAVGNLLEVLESVDVLKGKGPKDVHDLSIYFAALALLKAKKFESIEQAKSALELLIENGSAYAKFKEMVKAQGGSLETLENDSYKKAKYMLEFKAKKSGYVSKCDALLVAKACKLLGAGREKKGEPINHRVGILLNKKISDKTAKNEVLAWIYADDETLGKNAKDLLKKAFEIVDYKVKAEPLILDTLF